MNWAIWLGICLGAASAISLSHGTHLSSQKTSRDSTETVRTEVNRVMQRIDAVQRDIADRGSTAAPQSSSSPAPAALAQRQAQQELADIDQTFSKWAADYIKDRDLRKLSLEREQLDARATEIALSKEYRPIFQEFVDSVRAAIRAYNAKTGSAYEADLHDLPTNLYGSPSNTIEVGTVHFASDVL